jgi:ATP-dependent protease ClpP protease subunit
MNELWAYDVIGEDFMGEGVSAKSVKAAMEVFDKNQPILVRINSPGGNVFDAVAIKSQLDGWKAGVDVQVDGLAASAASYIAMAGRTVTMAKGSMLMVHDPWSVVVGNAAAMDAEANLLRKVAGQLAQAYAYKSGKDEEEMRAVMAAETWFTAEEAIEAGLANAMVESPASAYVVERAAVTQARLQAEALQKRLNLTRRLARR